MASIKPDRNLLDYTIRGVLENKKMQLPIQILVRLRQLLTRNGIKCRKSLFWRHANRFEGVLIQKWKKIVAILSKFTVLFLSSYFVSYFLKNKINLFL